MEESGPVYLLPTGPASSFLVVSDPEAAKHVLRASDNPARPVYDKGLVAEVRGVGCVAFLGLNYYRIASMHFILLFNYSTNLIHPTFYRPSPASLILTHPTYPPHPITTTGLRVPLRRGVCHHGRRPVARAAQGREFDEPDLPAGPFTAQQETSLMKPMAPRQPPPQQHHPVSSSRPCLKIACF